MTLFFRAAKGLFILCIPFFLLTTALRWEINQIRLYQYGFDKYEVSSQTGLESGELVRIAREMVDYFNSEEEFFQSWAQREEENFPLFSPKEVAHLKDVKGLIQLNYQVQIASSAYLLVYLSAGIFLRQRRFWQDTTRAAFLGSGLTLALMFALGLGILLGFEHLFLLFHYVGFRNLLWILEPTDYLLMMFPEGFFRDAALLAALLIIAQAVFLGGITALLSAFLRRKGLAAGGAAGGAATATSRS